MSAWMDTDADTWRDDPKRHAFQPNGDGHALNPHGCWWCGNPREKHAIERVRTGWDESGRGVWEFRAVKAEAGEGGQT